MQTRARAGRMAVGILSGMFLVAVAACGNGPSASPAPPTTRPAPGTSAPDTPAPPGPTDVPTATAPAAPLICGEAVRRPGTAPLAQIAGLEVVNDGGIGRIVLSFLPAGMAAVPEVEVRPATPPFVMDPSGMPLEVPGVGFVTITLFGGTALDENYEPTFEGPFDVDPAGVTPIVAFRRAGDFEAVSSFVVGLDGAPCVRILPPDGTGRLVIELETEE